MNQKSKTTILESDKKLDKIAVKGLTRRQIMEDTQPACSLVECLQQSANNGSQQP